MGLNSLLGQTPLEVEEPTFLPSSPTMEEFKKYTGFPVDLFTGLVPYSYAIYNWELDGLNISLSLNYHSSGIRVSEKAPWVGLGWNLSAGASINRQVRGLPDDGTGGYYDVNANDEIANFLSLDANYANLTQTEKDYVDLFKENAAKGPFDGEPDIYTYSVFGHSGRFLIDTDGTIVLIEGYGVKIEGGITNGFVITDSYGNRFYFNSGDSENMDIFPSGGADDYSYVSGWKLSKITTFKNNSIDFYYSSYAVQVFSTPSEQFRYTQDNTGVKTFNRNVSTGTTYSSGKLLDSIVSPRLKITFGSDTNRQDVGKKLNDVFVEDFNSKEIVHYKFEYQYNPRLLLSSIQRESNGEYLPKTTFTYFGGTFPDYDSKAVDYWGYYNGASSNQSYVPKEYYETFANDWGYANLLADRFPNLNYTRIGVLKEIDYPTGGKMVLEYELNEYGYTGTIPYSSSAPTGNYSTDQVTYLTSCSAPYGDDVTGCTNSSNLITVCDNITFEADLTYSSQSGYNVKTFTAPSSYNGYFFIYANLDGEGDATASFVRLEDMNGNILYNLQNTNATTYPTSTNPINSVVDDNIVVLQEGVVYKLISNVDDDCRGSYISISNVTYDIENQINKTVGGLRVKRISQYSDDQTLALQKEYDYHIELDSLRSSGVVKSGHLPKKSEYSDEYPAQLDYFDHVTIHSEPLLDYGTTKGSHITYKKVTEKIIDFINAKEQQIQHYFSSPYDYQDDLGNYEFPYTSRINNNYRLGLKDSILTFNESGNLVAKKNNDYWFKNFNTPVTVVGINFGATKLVNGQPVAEGVVYHQYSHTAVSNSLQKSESSTLIEAGVYSIESKTDFYYDNDIHLLPTRRQTTTSDGDVILNEIYYPDDVVSVTSLGTPNITLAQKNEIDKLKQAALHQIGRPVQVESTKNGNRVVQRTNYNDWGAGLVLPDTIRTLKGSSSIEDRLVYHSYDTYGNPIEVSTPDSPHAYYIWGYNSSLLIAKIDNLKASEVTASLQSLIDSAVAASNADSDRTFGPSGSEGALRTALGNIRENSALSGALMTYYTYDPGIGVTSMTDSRGYTTYYEYDDFHRLKDVKDAKGNLIKDYKYHYKGQN